MKKLTCILLAAAFAGGPAAATDTEFAPALFWGADFGGFERAAELRYGLAVNFDRAGATVPALLRLETASSGFVASLAGVPVAGRRLQMNQAEGEALAASSPWYARQWVWWTAGGLAATAALVGSGGGSITHDSTTTTNEQNETGVLCDVGNGGGTVVGGGEDCVASTDDLPVQPLIGVRMNRAGPGADALAADPTGYMGDLVAR